MAQEIACPNFRAAVESVSFPKEAIDLRMSEGNAVVAFTIRADGVVEVRFSPGIWAGGTLRRVALTLQQAVKQLSRHTSCQVRSIREL